MCLGSPDERLMAKITTETTNKVIMDMKNLRTRNLCIVYSPGLFPVTREFSPVKTADSRVIVEIRAELGNLGSISTLRHW